MTEQPDRGDPAGPPPSTPDPASPPRREDGTPGLPNSAPTQVVPTGIVPPPRAPGQQGGGQPGPYGAQQYPPQPGPGQQGPGQGYGPPPGYGQNPYGPPPGSGPNPYGPPAGSPGAPPTPGAPGAPGYGPPPGSPPGSPLGPPQYGQPPGQAGQPPAGYGPGAFPPPPPVPSGTSGFAITALVMGILGFLWIPIILAFVFGILALKRISRSAQGGKGLAITGMVLAGLWILLYIILGVTGAFTVTTSGTPSAAPTAPVGPGGAPVSPPGSTDPTSGQTVNAIELVVGDCVSQMGGGVSADVQLTVIDCAQPHQGEVFAVFDLPTAAGAPYPGDAEVSQQAAVRCNDELATYSPSAVTDPSIDITLTYPLPETWVTGNRGVQCIAVSDPPATGSIKGR